MSRELTTAVSSSPQALSPVQGAERLVILDVLRGFALLGILLINLTAFKGAAAPPGLGFDGQPLDLWVLRGLVLFVESKFFTLFSFLFGLGFAVGLLRAQERGVRFLPRFSRRLLGLLILGALHITLLWEGDILVLYALAGAVLLLFRRMSPARLLRWAAGLLLVPLVLFAVGLVALEVARLFPETGAALREADRTLLAAFDALSQENLTLYRESDFLALAGHRLESYAGVFPLLLSRLPTVLSMFLLGLWVGRTGVLRDIGAHLGLLSRVRFWGLTLGLGVSALVVLAQGTLGALSALVALAFNQALAGPLLALGYGATLVLWVHARQPRAVRPVAALGRMALSTYLGQSLIATLLFNGYGLGWYGRVTPSGALLIGLLIYALQLGLSTLWLRFFRFGPAEWALRSLTYGRLQPLRTGPPVEA